MTGLRLGLIGCGRAAERIYLRAVQEAAGVSLVAVADLRPERRQLLAAAVPGCRSFASAEALLAAQAVDAVVIATPPASHLVLATATVRAGLPVLVEKPLAPAPAGVAALSALAAAESVPVMIGFNLRHWEAVHRLRRALHQQTPPGTTARQVFTTSVAGWDSIDEPVDALDDLGCHQLDLLRFLFGRDILAVSARWQGTDGIRMQITLAGEVEAECLAAHGKDYQEWIEVRAGRRHYRLRPGSECIEPANGPLRQALDLGEAWRRRLAGRESSFRHSYARQLEAFSRTIAAGATASPGLEDGLAVIEAAAAARRSASQNGVKVGVRS